MSHGITQLANGNYSFCHVKGTAPGWHNLGTEYEGEENVHRIAAQAGADFRTGIVELQLHSDEYPQVNGVQVDERYLIRLDNFKPLASVGPEYQMVENSEVWNYLQQWIDAGLAKLDTAGSLFGGLKNFVNLKMVGEPLVIKGNDTMELHLLTMNPFDGKTAIFSGFTNIRSVCNNTVTAAIQDKASKMLRIRHRGDMTFKLETAQNVLRLAYEDQTKNAEMFRFLASKPILENDLLIYIKKLWGIDLQKPYADIPTRTKNMLDGVLSAVNSGAGQNMPETRGTYYWAFQGVNFYQNHIDGRNPQNRMNNLLFGTGRAFDQQALELAISMAQAA